MYKALTAESGIGAPSPYGPALCGFKCANTAKPGFLTNNQSVRLHSCEKGTGCSVFFDQNVVYIVPIISRDSHGVGIPELGAGGGGRDLTQAHQIEVNDPKTADELMRRCSDTIHNKEARRATLNLIQEALASRWKTISLTSLPLSDELEDMPLGEVVMVLQKVAEVASGASAISSNRGANITDARDSDAMDKCFPSKIVCISAVICSALLTNQDRHSRILATRHMMNFAHLLSYLDRWISIPAQLMKTAGARASA